MLCFCQIMKAIYFIYSPENTEKNWISTNKIKSVNLGCLITPILVLFERESISLCILSSNYLSQVTFSFVNTFSLKYEETDLCSLNISRNLWVSQVCFKWNSWQLSPWSIKKDMAIRELRAVSNCTAQHFTIAGQAAVQPLNELQWR